MNNEVRNYAFTKNYSPSPVFFRNIDVQGVLGRE